MIDSSILDILRDETDGHISQILRATGSILSIISLFNFKVFKAVLTLRRVSPCSFTSSGVQSPFVIASLNDSISELIALKPALSGPTTLGTLSRSSGLQGGHDVSHTEIIREANHCGKRYCTEISGAALALQRIVSH